MEYGLIGVQRDEDPNANEESDSEEIDENKSEDDEEFEVGKFLAVCFGDPNKTGNKKLHFKVFSLSNFCSTLALSYHIQ